MPSSWHVEMLDSGNAKWQICCQQVVELLWARPLVVLYNMSVAGVRVVEFGTKRSLCPCCWTTYCNRRRHSLMTRWMSRCESLPHTVMITCWSCSTEVSRQRPRYIIHWRQWAPPNQLELRPWLFGGSMNVTYSRRRMFLACSVWRRAVLL